MEHSYQMLVTLLRARAVCCSAVVNLGQDLYFQTSGHSSEWWFNYVAWGTGNARRVLVAQESASNASASLLRMLLQAVDLHLSF